MGHKDNESAINERCLLPLSDSKYTTPQQELYFWDLGNREEKISELKLDFRVLFLVWFILVFCLTL